MEEIGKYDTVVIGAGPAGSSVARELAQNEISTLLVERKYEVGIPVLCGEYLPELDELRDMFPRSTRVEDVCRVPDKLVLNKCKSIVLVSPAGKEYEFPMRANVIDRAAFDQHLVDMAVEAGAEIVTGVNFKKELPGKHAEFLSAGNILRAKFDVLVGADGPLSNVAKYDPKLSRQNRGHLSKSIQYRIKGEGFDPKRVYMFFGTVAPGGYAWIIPRSSTEANVGLGLRPQFSQISGSLKKYIHAFIQRKLVSLYGIRKISVAARISALIPVLGPVRNTVSNHSLLVGDAASHVMPTNGGGIPTALMGGQIAGEAITKHLESDSPLSLYEEKWKAEFGTELYTAASLLSIASIPMMSDSITEWAMQFFGSSALEEVIRCRVPYPFQGMTGLINRSMTLAGVRLH